MTDWIACGSFACQLTMAGYQVRILRRIDARRVSREHLAASIAEAGARLRRHG